MDYDKSQFYKVILQQQQGAASSAGTKVSPIFIDDAVTLPDVDRIKSVLGIIRNLPLQTNICVVLSFVQNIVNVLEMPTLYDGYVAYELPPQKEKSSMHGMEQRFDGHVWNEYVTCSSDLFNGFVCFSRCGGHLRCCNVECPYYLRSITSNES